MKVSGQLLAPAAFGQGFVAIKYEKLQLLP
jgi:hypothetical protein